MKLSPSKADMYVKTACSISSQNAARSSYTVNCIRRTLSSSPLPGGVLPFFSSQTFPGFRLHHRIAEPAGLLMTKLVIMAMVICNQSCLLHADPALYIYQLLVNGNTDDLSHEHIVGRQLFYLCHTTFEIYR